MNADCRRFRDLLAGELAEHAGDPRAGVVRAGEEHAEVHALRSLSWHEHLAGCGACRELLAAEEALELLLASLPEPKLPPALAERVLARLHAGSELDRLLERARDVRVPAGLAARLLEGLRDERAHPAVERLDPDLERHLDLWLERDSEPVVPAGLAERVLARLGDRARVTSSPARASASAGASPSSSARLVRASHTRWRIALAAGLFATCALAAWLASRGAGGPTGDAAGGREDRTVGAPAPDTAPEPRPDRRPLSSPRVAVEPRPPDEEMLGALEVLEHWDLLMHEDVEILLSTIDSDEQWLIEYQSRPAPPPPSEPPSRG